MSVRLAAAGLLCLAAPVAAAGWTAAALAQERLPPSALPDVRLPQVPPPEVPAPMPEIPLPEAPPARAPAGAESVRLVFGGFLVEGASAYPAGELEALWRPAVGREVSLADVYGFARAIQQRYREDGYFLSRVIVPEQTVRDGRFRLRVLEGFVADVGFEGDIGPAQDLLASYFAAVQAERPLRLATLERALLLSNDVPGISATALLRSSAREAGAADLVVTLQRRPFGGFFTLDNYGDEFTGEWEAGAGLSANAFTPLGEQLTVIGFASEPWREHSEAVGQVGGSWRLGGGGLFFEALFSYGDSNPGADLEELGFDSKELLASLHASYPLLRGRDLSAWLRVGFEYINARTDVFGGELFSRDRLRVLTLSGRSEFRDGLGGTNSGELGLRQGLPILDATRRDDEFKSREDATASATVLRASAARLQPLPLALSLYADVAGQYAFDRLLTEEQFDVGGTQFGRGYDFSEVSGDHGLGVTVELRYTYRFENAVLATIQPFGFYDFGRVWDRGISEPQTLSSAGIGVRASALEFLTVEVAVAKPIAAASQRADGTRDPQILFRSVGRF